MLSKVATKLNLENAIVCSKPLVCDSNGIIPLNRQLEGFHGKNIIYLPAGAFNPGFIITFNRLLKCVIFDKNRQHFRFHFTGLVSCVSPTDRCNELASSLPAVDANCSLLQIFYSTGKL